MSYLEFGQSLRDLLPRTTWLVERALQLGQRLLELMGHGGNVIRSK